MQRKHNVLMFASFVSYYLILFAERASSIIRSLTDPKIGFSKMFLGGIFNKYVYGLTIFCMFVSLIIALRILGSVLANGVGATSKLLIINSGILLVSGMLDTPYSITVIQFIAYIFLFIACLTKFIEIMQKKEAVASTIASFIYFIAFAMAIPVVHKSDSVLAGKKLYYIAEALASGGLVVTLTIFITSAEKIILSMKKVRSGGLAIESMMNNLSILAARVCTSRPLFFRRLISFLRSWRDKITPSPI